VYCIVKDSFLAGGTCIVIGNICFEGGSGALSPLPARLFWHADERLSMAVESRSRALNASSPGLKLPTKVLQAGLGASEVQDFRFRHGADAARLMPMPMPMFSKIAIAERSDRK
jgi:hypothetical protein